ncbi:DUF4825 domain-containing protein [Pseudomonas sp. IT-P171]|uniref:hypothetical protein n=1 Tax=Pseudomonas sp. IT-P171 TaxID=3026453 RepID=UPI0039E06DC1
MDKIISVLFASLIAASSLSVSAETFERVELDDHRTSVQYAGPIKAVTKVIEGYKWLGQTNEMNGGVVFEAYDNPDFGKNDTESGGAIMVKAIFHTYQDVSKEAIMVARQSKIAGFVELYGYDSPDLQLHIKVIDDNTFEAFSSDRDYKNKEKLFAYKKVEKFNKSPYADRLESAEDSGVFY